jgi:hypothetical protein
LTAAALIFAATYLVLAFGRLPFLIAGLRLSRFFTTVARLVVTLPAAQPRQPARVSDADPAGWTWSDGPRMCSARFAAVAILRECASSDG